MAKINLNKFTGMFNNENFELEGFELEFAPDEIPAILKAAMPIINMAKESADSSNAREIENLCNKLNEANEKLRKAEREVEILKSNVEYHEKRKAEEKIRKEMDLFRKSLLDAGMEKAVADIIVKEKYEK